MVVLVTGSNGFVGRNLVWNLKEIRDGKNQTRPNLMISEIYGFDKESTQEELEYACSRCDFVFNLAGVNRPKDKNEFKTGNCDFTERLISTLKKCDNNCPIMLSSSIQATLTGRFEGSEYGKSKLAAEELVRAYGRDTGSRTLIYRFPNLFGKWCKPNYNSVIATFCNAVANDLDYRVDDPQTELELVYIDDLVEEMLDALEGKEHRTETEDYCYVPISHSVTLGRVVEILNVFKSMPDTLVMPEIPFGSFEKKLFSTYLTYLPSEKLIYSFKGNVDNRGNFTELIRTANCGQVSINVAKPGITRGEHWHNSKWEIFIVVSGHALIQQRRIGIDPETGEEYPVIEFEVTGDQIRAVQMIPGYTHNIKNLSETENLVTVMWANEQFDCNHPDTFYEKVVISGSPEIRQEKGNL